MNASPAIHMHGDQSNLLIANEYQARQDLLDIDTAKAIADALNSQYPGHLWAVNVSGEQGVATIHNLMLSGTWGYRLHLDKRYSASDLRRAAILGAGELLERYNVSRGRANMDDLSQKPVDFAGQVIGDKS